MALPDTDPEEVVRAYLHALRRHRPRRGRPRSPARLAAELQQVERAIEKIKDTGDPIEVLELVQRRLDLVQQIDARDRAAELDELESGFTDIARSYSAVRRISYAAWRELGVPATVLRRAGLAPRRDTTG